MTMGQHQDVKNQRAQSERVIMRLGDWPTEDRVAWDAATSPIDPFSDTGGERAGLRAHSNRRLRDSYGRWLTFLEGQGFLTGPPAFRITKDSLERYVRELHHLGNLPSTMRLRLTDLLLMARLFDPQADWRFISHLAENVGKLPGRSRDKRQFLRGSDELYSLGLRLMEHATLAKSPVKTATLYRDGLMIALLALVPLRGSNFVQLRLGNELQKVGDQWFISIPGSATKNHAPLDFEWPASLVEKLETYLHLHRPLLMMRKYRWLSRAGDRLWVAQSGSAVTRDSFFCIITKRTQAAFGKAINPHAFRDAAATTIAIHDPGHVRITAPVLGHTSPATSEKFYNQARTLEAQRLYASTLDQLRRQTRKSQP